jgi:hypothetical protein
MVDKSHNRPGLNKNSRLNQGHDKSIPTALSIRPEVLQSQVIPLRVINIHPAGIKSEQEVVQCKLIDTMADGLHIDYKRSGTMIKKRILLLP